MSVDPSKLNQSVDSACVHDDVSGDGSLTAACGHDVSQFQNVMRSESAHAWPDDTVRAHMQAIDQLAQEESLSPEQINEMKTHMQAVVARLSETGALDFDQLPDVGDGSGLKRISDNLAVDPADGSIHILRVGADGEMTVTPLPALNAADVQALVPEFASVMHGAVEKTQAQTAFKSADFRPAAFADFEATMSTPPSTVPSEPTARAIVDGDPSLKQYVTQQALAPQTRALDSTLITLDPAAQNPLDTRALSAQQMQATVTTMRESGTLDFAALANASGDSGLKVITPKLAVDPASGALWGVSEDGTHAPIATLKTADTQAAGSELLAMARSAQGDTSASGAATPPVAQNTQAPPSVALQGDAATGSAGSAQSNPEVAKLDELIATHSPTNDNSNAILAQSEVVARGMLDESGTPVQQGGDANADDALAPRMLTDQIRYDPASDELQVRRPGDEGALEWQALSSLRGDQDAIISLGNHVSDKAGTGTGLGSVQLGDYGGKIHSALNGHSDLPDYLQGMDHAQLTSQAKAETIEWLTMNEQEPLGRGDLNGLSKAAYRAGYGELGLPIKEDGGALRDLSQWINATSTKDLNNMGGMEQWDGEHTQQLSYTSGSDAAKEQWLSLSKAERLEHFGIDVASWERAQPFIETGTAAYEMRQAMKTDYGTMAVMVVGTIMTAGALSAAFPAMAASLGTAGVNAVSTTLVNGAMTGDWGDAVKAGVTSYVGGAAGDIAAGSSATAFGQFAIEAGINGTLAEINGGSFKDGVIATGVEQLPQFAGTVADSLNIKPGTWQSVAFDAVVGGVAAELDGGKFSDGFKTVAAESAGALIMDGLADQLETDNPYLALLIEAGRNGLAHEFSGGKFEDGVKYTALQQLPAINAALHERLDAEEGSFLSSLINAGTNGVAYELGDKNFADGFWESTAADLAAYIENKEPHENPAIQALIEAGAAGVISEMNGGEFGDGFAKVLTTLVPSYAGGIATEHGGEVTGAMTEAFMKRLIENGGDIQDALIAAGRAGFAAHQDLADANIYNPAYDFGDSYPSQPPTPVASSTQ